LNKLEDAAELGGETGKYYRLERSGGCGGVPPLPKRKPVRGMPGERQRSRQPANGLLAGKAAGDFPAGCFGPNRQALPGGVAGAPPRWRG
jgi:hypothetical protein